MTIAQVMLYGLGPRSAHVLDLMDLLEDLKPLADPIVLVEDQGGNSDAERLNHDQRRGPEEPTDPPRDREVYRNHRGKLLRQQLDHDPDRPPTQGDARDTDDLDDQEQEVNGNVFHD